MPHAPGSLRDSSRENKFVYTFSTPRQTATFLCTSQTANKELGWPWPPHNIIRQFYEHDENCHLNPRTLSRWVISNQKKKNQPHNKNLNVIFNLKFKNSLTFLICPTPWVKSVFTVSKTDICVQSVAGDRASSVMSFEELFLVRKQKTGRKVSPVRDGGELWVMCWLET